MKHYMNKLAADIEEIETIEQSRFEAALKLLSGGTLSAGAKCAWCYQDDVDYWKHFKLPMPHPKDWPYSGIIIPIPNVDGRGSLEPEQCAIVVLDYPIEKENPEVDWATLMGCLTSPGLHRFHVMSTIRAFRN